MILLNHMSKISEYLKETKSELKQVNWPSRRQTTLFTVLVIVISIVIAYFLGLFDFLFSAGLTKLLEN